MKKYILNKFSFYHITGSEHGKRRPENANQLDVRKLAIEPVWICWLKQETGAEVSNQQRTT